MSEKELITKKDLSRVRSEINKVSKQLDLMNKPANVETTKLSNPFTGGVTGNYWTQTGMPWVSDDARKAVLTEWFWQPIRGQPRRRRYK